MSNEYEKYWVINEKEWHENEIGIYHISAVGISHQDLEPEEHSGPCLRNKYFVYLEGENHNLATTGNFKMGNYLHAEAQEIYKKNHPNSVGEFPIVYELDSKGNEFWGIEEEEEEYIIIKGSVDIVDFDIQINPDLKTASMFTFPSSEYDMSPTYMTQVTLYTYILNEFVFRPTWYRAESLMIVYFKKHNLTTLEQFKKYSDEMGKEVYDEFIRRVRFLHNCLMDREVPDAEPNKWCKYCPKLDYCLEEGDIVLVKEGRKKRYVKNG